MSGYQHSGYTPHYSERVSDVLPGWAVGAIICQFDIEIDGFWLTPALDFGLFTLPESWLAGFLCPYHLEGSSITDAPDVIVSLPGFEAPSTWCHHLVATSCGDAWAETGAGMEILPFKKVPASGFVSIMMPTRSDGAEFETLRPWLDQFGQMFLMMGRLIGPDAEVVISCGQFPHPLSWQSPA